MLTWKVQSLCTSRSGQFEGIVAYSGEPAVLQHLSMPCRIADLDTFVEAEDGDCIEDMDMFHKALVLYIRSRGVPCIRVVPLPTGALTTWQCCPAVLKTGKVWWASAIPELTWDQHLMQRCVSSRSGDAGFKQPGVLPVIVQDILELEKCPSPWISGFLWASQSLRQGQTLISMLVQYLWRRHLPSCLQSSSVWTLLIQHACSHSSQVSLCGAWLAIMLSHMQSLNKAAPV